MTNKQPKYRTNTDNSVQRIIKIKKSLKRKYIVTNYMAIQNAFLEVGYDQKALENDEWFIDLVIAKIKSDNNKSTYQFIMNIVYSILIAVFGLDILSTEPFVVTTFLLSAVVLIGLALHSIYTDFQNSMLLEILTIVKNSKKFFNVEINNDKSKSSNSMFCGISKISKSIIKETNENINEILSTLNAVYVIQEIIGTTIGIILSIILIIIKFPLVIILGVFEFILYLGIKVRDFIFR